MQPRWLWRPTWLRLHTAATHAGRRRGRCARLWRRCSKAGRRSLPRARRRAIALNTTSGWSQPAFLDVGGHAGRKGERGVGLLNISRLGRDVGEEEGLAARAADRLLQQVGELRVAVGHVRALLAERVEHVGEGRKRPVDRVRLCHLLTLGLGNLGALASREVHDVEHASAAWVGEPGAGVGVGGPSSSPHKGQGEDRVRA
mmetsp:Transcript_122403/g.346030  ORF Transcript_122403/g.346030 Transcript_122403/m.346030 type:complete len:201 (-) Transcript_122403:1718-2320(-)